MIDRSVNPINGARNRAAFDSAKVSNPYYTKKELVKSALAGAGAMAVAKVRDMVKKSHKPVAAGAKAAIMGAKALLKK